MHQTLPLKVIIFGATAHACIMVNELSRDARIELLGFYDNDERKWGTKFMGLNVWPAANQKECSAHIIYVCSLFIRAITNQLNKLGYINQIAWSKEQLTHHLDKHMQSTQQLQASGMFNHKNFIQALQLAQNFRNPIDYVQSQQKDFDGTIAISVCANNQISLATVMAASFLRAHPQGRVIICLGDLRQQGHIYPDTQDARIEVIQAHELNIEHFENFAFQYNIFEFCCALKAYALQYAMQKPGTKKLLYLDADGLVLAPFEHILKLLDEYSIVLTPHRFKASSRYIASHECQLLFTGIFNAGFLALNVSKQSQEFLCWWAQRLYRDCLQDDQGNYFVDQRWLNEVPALFSHVHILREPGVNVAMWNAELNPISFRNTRFWVGQNNPLIFYHFSKVSLTDWTKLFHSWLSFTAPTPGLSLLVSLYRILILQAYRYNKNETQPIWAYGCFSNGISITPCMRKIFRNKSLTFRWKNPFNTQGKDTYWHWLNSTLAPNICLTNLFAYLNVSASNPIDKLSIEDKAQHAFDQFIKSTKKQNHNNIDLVFYKKVIQHSKHCSWLTSKHLKAIPQNLLQQL